MSAAQPLNEPFCPLCGGANQCAVVRSGRLDVPCWCEKVAFDRETLNAVASAQRGLACLCAACAAAAHQSTFTASAPAEAAVSGTPKIGARNNPGHDFTPDA